MGVKEFTILPPLEFISDVQEEANKATKRIFLQAMEVESGEITDHLLNVLLEGSKKGLSTSLHVDYYSLLVTDGLFNYLPLLSPSKTKKRNKRLEKRKAYFAGLQKSGVKVVFTNYPSLLSKIFPMFGRNHMKIAIVDDVAWIGGINYHDDNFKSNDSMVKITDPKIVEEIVSVFEAVENKTLHSDKKIHCTDNTVLLIDSGKVGTSLILDETIRQIDHAKESVSVITPIIPDTKLARALTKAQEKKVQIQVTVPGIERMKGIYVLLDLFNEMTLFLLMRGIPVVFKHTPIHAKIIIIDNKTVILGSHNFTTRGVAMGTEELAIISKDPYLLSQAQSFMRHVLNW